MPISSLNSQEDTTSLSLYVSGEGVLSQQGFSGDRLIIPCIKLFSPWHSSKLQRIGEVIF